jgi:signal transduction histidine kinase/ActR/RegA family two-component response regulator
VKTGTLQPQDLRLLFLPPTARDFVTTKALLGPAGIALHTCGTLDDLLAAMQEGAAAVMLPEETVAGAQHQALQDALARQPAWSDLPVLLLTRNGTDSAALRHAMRTLGNVTLLERPLRQATLLSAVQTAVRGRTRQYQIREHLEERARTEASLRAADQRKDEFLATLGHELRNPLAPLLTALQLLKHAGVDHPVVNRVSGVMDRQVAHLVRLVNDLLEVSRITRGQIAMHRKALDLAFVVHSAIDTSRPVVDAAGHQLIVEMPGEPLVVFGDAVRLTQILSNLLTNAAKYTDAGGCIHIRVERQDGRALISVRDNGIGIERAQLGSVFDMFTQVDRSSRRAQGGLGIGLTLVRSLVEMHGGTVEARSDGIGHGSEFRVELPLLTTTPVPPDASVERRRLPPRRVLLVDDNVDAAETLAALLTDLGATVLVENSGAAALEAIETFAPDAVLLDIGMPGMDGHEVARRIRTMRHHANVQLIALTGWGQEHDRERSRAAGINHHVVKPPDIDYLCALLTEAAPART